MTIFTQFTNPAQDGAPLLLNEFLETLQCFAVYGKNVGASTGLAWPYYGGRWAGFSVAAGTFTLTDNSDNYIVVALASGVTTCTAANTNWNDTTNYRRAYKVTTVSGAVTATEDHRVGTGGLF